MSDGYYMRALVVATAPPGLSVSGVAAAGTALTLYNQRGETVAGHPAMSGKELLARGGLSLAPDAIEEEDASKQGANTYDYDVSMCDEQG